MVLFSVTVALRPAVSILKNFGTMVPVRRLSSKELTKNLTLFSDSKKIPKITDLKVESLEVKPLVILLSWLMSKKKHISKYARFYTDKGFDVVNLSITPWQLMWPVKGAQVVSKDLLAFLEKNESYKSILIHGFSVGGYVWSEALVHMQQDRDRYQAINDRISGQVWDSLADIQDIPVGFPHAVFPQNERLQSLLRRYILYHMKVFDQVATVHYQNASECFYNNIVRAPALFFVSKQDPIGNEKRNQILRQAWEDLGIQTYWKCWDDSPHVSHFLHYPEEYTGALSDFLGDIGLIEKELLKSKL